MQREARNSHGRQHPRALRRQAHEHRGEPRVRGGGAHAACRGRVVGAAPAFLPARGDQGGRRGHAQQRRHAARQRGAAALGQLLHHRSRACAHRLRGGALGAQRGGAARVPEQAARDADRAGARGQLGRRGGLQADQRLRRRVRSQRGRGGREPAAPGRPDRAGRAGAGHVPRACAAVPALRLRHRRAHAVQPRQLEGGAGQRTRRSSWGAGRAKRCRPGCSAS
jgi:hypothetical protein